MEDALEPPPLKVSELADACSPTVRTVLGVARCIVAAYCVLLCTLYYALAVLSEYGVMMASRVFIHVHPTSPLLCALFLSPS